MNVPGGTSGEKNTPGEAILPKAQTHDDLLLTGLHQALSHGREVDQRPWWLADSQQCVSFFLMM